MPHKNPLPSLHLRRAYQDPAQSSAGFWWLEELPGAAVVRRDEQRAWSVVNLVGDERIDALLERTGLRGQRFDSRREALAAAQIACTLPSSPADDSDPAGAAAPRVSR